jgi:hypothetical protein
MIEVYYCKKIMINKPSGYSYIYLYFLKYEIIINIHHFALILINIVTLKEYHNLPSYKHSAIKVGYDIGFMDL